MNKYLWMLLAALLLTSCEIEPPLHLHNEDEQDIDLPQIDLNLEVYWSYMADYELQADYDWQSYWFYGWDDEDRRIFGELGYVEPTVFNLRRYFTGQEKGGAHSTAPLANQFEGTSFSGTYQNGYYDILAWNNVTTLDGVQSLHIDESAPYEEVIAYTNPSMYTSRYNAPRFQNAFYQPEPLFAAYDTGIYIPKDNWEEYGFVWVPERNRWVLTLHALLEPCTYIYLTQVILHHNNGRITGVDGNGNLSGMARSVCLNTGIAGSDAITVNYNNRFKQHCSKYGEDVDIAGGRLMTFGMCNLNPNRIATETSRSSDTETRQGMQYFSNVQELLKHIDEVDPARHYLDVNFQFNNGLDSTFVFDVTDQVRKYYRGGIITVELDVDEVQLPQRKTGSGFDAVVVDPEEEEYEFDMTRRKTKKK